MNAKTEILNRIRTAQKQAGLPDRVDVPRAYVRSGSLSTEQLQEMLVDRLEDYKATVRVVEASALADAIADAVTDTADSGSAAVPVSNSETGAGASSGAEVVYAEGMDASLFTGIPGARPDDRESDPRTLDSARAVVTESHVTCAQTGTIVLEAGPQCGRRALTLVPDRHVCIVRSSSIVYGIPEVMERLDPFRPATWISGPSATSDIELSRVEGVHGPRQLVVLIVADS